MVVQYRERDSVRTRRSSRIAKHGHEYENACSREKTVKLCRGCISLW